MLHRWESETTFGFIKRVDKGRVNTVKDLQSCHSRYFKEELRGENHQWRWAERSHFHPFVKVWLIPGAHHLIDSCWYFPVSIGEVWSSLYPGTVFPQVLEFCTLACDLHALSLPYIPSYSALRFTDCAIQKRGWKKRTLADTSGLFLESPEKPFVKLRHACSVKLVISHVVKGQKN